MSRIGSSALDPACLVLACLVACLATGCASSSAPEPGPRERPATTPTPSEAPRAREGITVERVPGPALPPPADPALAPPGDGLVTLVRLDLTRYRLALLTEAEHGGRWQTLPAWAAEAHLVAGINAAMFEPEGQASGLLVDEGVERAPDDPRFGGILAFDPVDAADAPFTMVGRDCPGVDLAALRARYRSLVANYRMLDCDGAPIAWVDESVYSSAAFARDTRGRFVLVHAETPYRMRDLARVLSDPALGLTDIHYVEGGPKASLWVDDGTGAPRSLVGSRREDDGHVVTGPRPIPNVLGVLPRG